MNWTSILAIYLLFWVMTGFFVLPFHARSASEDASTQLVPGQAESAPANFRPWPILWQTTLISAIAFGAYYYAYTHGMIPFAN